MDKIPEKKQGGDISDSILDQFASEAGKADRASQYPKVHKTEKKAQNTKTEKAESVAAIRSVPQPEARADSGKNGAVKPPLRKAKGADLPPVHHESAEKRSKIAFWSMIGVSVFILAAFVVYVVFFQEEKPKSEETVVVGGIEMYDPGSVFSSLSYRCPDGLVFPDGIQEKYKALYAANQSFVGWLSVPNTTIDTAVYQAGDNDYYLKKDLWGKYSRYGTVFLDAYDDVANMRRNSVIYGHNFDDDGDDSYDDIIFGDVHKYLDVEFYRTAPVIEFNTLYRDYKWKVFACFYTNGDSTGDNDYLFYYIATGMNDENFMAYMDEVEQRSYIHTAVDVQPSDKILTLSTCTYFFDRGGSLQNARCVLVARMVRDGESEQVDVAAAKQNENPRYPQLYYNVFGGQNPYRNDSKWYPVE